MRTAVGGATACRYVHSVREDGLSDHPAAILVELKPGATEPHT